MKSLQESLFDTDLTNKKHPLAQYANPKNRGDLQIAILHGILFSGAQPGDTVDLNWIDVSKIKDMSYLFKNYFFEYPDNSKNYIGFHDYNYDVSKWNVKNVRFMNGMFANCRNFNCDISDWDVDNVSNMAFMFMNCSSFDQDLSKWDISSAIKTKRQLLNMFDRCPISYKHMPKVNF